jgi:hypothetical protein
MMFGEPSDVDGACNARLFIADNYGDNSATIRCQLAPGHDGPNREQFERQGPVTITWTVDERERCDHGCGQWDHDHEDYAVVATAHIDGSHGGAHSQNGLRASARRALGHYEIQIAGILPPNSLATAKVESGSIASITTAVIEDTVHVLTCGSDGRPVDTDFRIEIARPLACPKRADDHEYSDCAYCHPGDPPLTCGHCGKTHYYEEGHLRHCAKKPFTCAICGESGLGNHDWPRGCPKELENFLARGNADEFTE